MPLSLKKTINPIKNIRFLETSFPFDSIIFRQDLFQNEKVVNCFTDVYDYKRVESVTFDEKRKVFIVKMHEKIYDKTLYKHNIKL